MLHVEPQMLLQQIDQNVLGIVWTTDVPLAHKPVGFNQVDYVFNGLLSMHIHNGKANDGINYFATTSFGNSLFLAHALSSQAGGPGEDKVLKGLTAILPKSEQKDGKVLVVTPKETNISKKHHASLTFIFMSLKE